MKKIYLFLALAVFPFIASHSAKLPDSGYHGPYQYGMDEYGNLIDYGSMYDEYGEYGFMTAAKEPLDNTTCSKAFCEQCLFAYYSVPGIGSILEAGPSDPNFCAALEWALGGGGSAFHDDYEICALNACGATGGNCDGPNPPLGCPIGAETSLLFFAFSYFALSLWRKRNQILNKKIK